MVTAVIENQQTPAPELNRLVQAPLFRRSLAEFHQLTGLAAKFVPTVLPEMRINFGCQDIEFCRLLASHFCSGCPLCRQIHSELNRRMGSKLKPHQICCPFGIVQVAVPVVVLGRHVATILGGNVRLDAACIQQRPGLDRQLRRCGLAGDLRPLQKSYLAIQVMDRAKLKVALRLLDQLSQLFAGAIAQEAIPASLTKPSLVVQIGQFIRQHLGERLTTRQTAAEFNLCEAYFCRCFRRLTGMTFHAYVTQLRVERAKVTLQATDARINEIALAHGFQSASDFDRIFKSFVGTTPSAFRGQRLQLRQSR
jgi:AraC-like DNA-binding protein/ligand-binding sensor protein